MANIFYQKLKSVCYLLLAISSLLKCFSTFAQSFLKFAAKMRYVWQGVIVAISRRIRGVKIAANSRYVCQGTYSKLSHFIPSQCIYFRCGAFYDKQLGRANRHVQPEQDARQARSPAHFECFNYIRQLFTDLCDIKTQTSAHSDSVFYSEFSPNGPYYGLCCSAFNGSCWGWSTGQLTYCLPDCI